MNNNTLGSKSVIPARYAPEVLYPIPRWPSRSLLDIDKKLPLFGFDHWHAYELSWLDGANKPRIAIGDIYVDARSENMIESKSLKLYLNSLNNESFKSMEQFEQRIRKDLTRLTQSEVDVLLSEPDRPALRELDDPDGQCIDGLELAVAGEVPDATLLCCQKERVTNQRLFSNLFRSNCPITGQPDWATLLMEYSGDQIDAQSLLGYVCSFRSHQGYHEECAEMIFRDIMTRCAPDHLVVGLQFTRRGGLDINPYRSNHPISPGQWQFRVRQNWGC